MTIFENDFIKVSTSGKDYDFIAVIENKTNEQICVHYEKPGCNDNYDPMLIAPNDLVGLLDGEEGRDWMKAIENNQIYIATNDDEIGHSPTGCSMTQKAFKEGYIKCMNDRGAEIAELNAENATLKTKLKKLEEKCEDLRNEKWDAQDDLDCYYDEMPNKIKQAKIEAVNDFAKKIKAKLFSVFGKTICSDFDTEDITLFIDEILKEILKEVEK